MDRTLISAVALILCAVYLLPATDGLEGRMFVIMFMNLSTNDSSRPGFMEILVNSLEDTNFRVEFPNPRGSAIYSLDANNKRSMNLSLEDDPSMRAELRPSANDAIFISSEKDVSITASISQAGTTGAYLAMPVTENAKEFFIPAWPGNSVAGSSFSVVSPAGDVCAEIYKVNGSHYERVEFMHLTRLGVKQYVDTSGDYTGYYVNGTRPMVVLGGHECAYIPGRTGYCDHIVEQVPSLVEWGKQFVMINPIGRNLSAGYFFRVVAGYDNTTITGESSNNETYIDTIHTGNFFEAEVGHDINAETLVTLECSEPCLVAQYNPGFKYAVETKETDPFMQIVPPLDHWPKDAKFGTNRYYREMADGGVEGNNHLLLMAKKADTGAIKVNGNVPTTWTDFDAFGGQYAWHSEPIAQGYYEVLTDGGDKQFMVVASGHGTVDDEHTAWSYLGGYLITDNEYPGQWYNLTALEVEFNETADPNPVVTNPDGLGLGPGLGDTVDYTQDITEDDIPYYEVTWVAKYYTKQRWGKIISRKCSEGYGRYLFEHELEYIQQDLNKPDSGLIALYCGSDAVGIHGDMSDLTYYSEYTRGEIKLKLSLQGTASHTLDQVIECAGDLKTQLKNYRAWSGSLAIGDENLILPDAEYKTEKCAPVFFRPDVFQHEGSGWMCSEKRTVISLSADATRGVVSIVVMATALWVALVFAQ
ncbi:hypothetical protein CAPTEDRAFT_196984 [Capitella teleta]|uniref:IgGFc-binding protein N-terminal domain-containing protein n=1 Tax=Capitella teleta TaxID=283909 RepID=R7TB76_CAPTE|nr:hypothetical protein CAPTEDRAFT_196984 [Capitella teleta]|eukprot:ELT90993.1 hypothetical protein CAPTEDRAFT_196984 [Capitella teleta]